MSIEGDSVTLRAPDDILRLLRQTDLLEALPRTGWITSRVPDPESVAAHSYGVAFTALLLTDLVAGRDPAPQIDRARVLEIALLHDVGEALLTDIPGPVKQFVGRDLVKATERRAVDQLVGSANPRYLDRYDEYEAAQTLESRIVHAADKIQLLVKASQYEAAGFRGVRRFWAGSTESDAAGIPEAAALLDRLRHHHGAGTWPTEDWE